MASHDSSEVRFAAYVTALVEVIGHADRATPLRDYCTGLLMPAGRKSVEPIAAVTALARVAAQHQQEWADDPARRKTAGVPEAITFQTKPEIALDQIRAAAEAGLPRGVI